MRLALIVKLSILTKDKKGGVESASLMNASINTTYPNFLALEISAGKGCAFCGLLRHALQDKYSDEKIAEAEGDFHPSIRATWPISKWNGQVTFERAVFFTEEDWAERDASLGTDQSLDNVYTFSLEIWPYPPRRSVTSPELNHSGVWFAVYADTGECETGGM